MNHFQLCLFFFNLRNLKINIITVKFKHIYYQIISIIYFVSHNFNYYFKKNGISKIFSERKKL